jgi:uncharacterized protein
MTTLRWLNGPKPVDFIEERADAGPVITGFRGNNFIVDGTVREGAVLLTATSLHPWVGAILPVGDLCALVDSMGVEGTPEMLLLGTGAALVRPAPADVAALEAKGIGIEVMDSRTAARIWNVLRAEGRDVVAALLPLDAI